ncbi:MAG: Ig-like domain-containing protein [Patescibacteria group bacterium]|jgi:hypothetical protein
MLFRAFNRNIKTATLLTSMVILVAVFVLPILALAQTSLGFEPVGSTGLGTRDLKDIIILIIKIFLGFLGIIAVGLIIWGGYTWMTSGGEEDKISEGKKIITNAVIGLVIILSSYAIVLFVVSKFDVANQPGGNVPNRDRREFDVNIGAFGGGILRSVYPEPGDRDVPRNAMIMVSFKERMDISSIIESNNQPVACANLPENITCGYLKEFTLPDESVVPAVKIINQNDDSNWLLANQVVVTTVDRQNFVFNPAPLLGSADGETAYSVNLSERILKDNGQAAFYSGGYTWSFEVSNVSDVTGPRVESVLPKAGSTVAKNAVIQINFNEALSLISATGHSTGNPGEAFNNLLISYINDQEAPQYLSGEFTISNRFRTIEFLPDQACTVDGQEVRANSCGVAPKCLPASQIITILAKAATVNEAGETVDLFSGLTDASGNSLDGNANGDSQGQPTDNFTSSFNTNNELDLTPPVIENITPDQGSANSPKNSRINAGFSEQLRSSTVNSDNFKVYKFACDGPAFPEQLSCYPEGGFNVYKENRENKTKAILRTYYPYLDPLTVYNPRLTAGIQDLYQNCFNPATGPCAEGQVSPGCR